MLIANFPQSSFYTWRVVFLISAAAYVGSALIFACLVPAEAQEWNFTKIREIGKLEKGQDRAEVRVEANKNQDKR